MTSVNQFLEVLQKIAACLHDNSIEWALTGSLGMALQGVPVEVHDIDIQTGRDGAYHIEHLFADYVVTPVHYLESDRIRSHFGRLEINGIKVEIMGDVQKRIDHDLWEEPVKVERHKRWIQAGNDQIPVLSLAYVYQAYLHLGRNAKAEKLKAWLQRERE